MRKFMAGLIVVGAFGLANIIGALAFVAAGKLALHLDPSANGSHLAGFMVAVIGVVAAVASAFPIFGHGMPWLAARLDHVWPEGVPERRIS